MSVIGRWKRMTCPHCGDLWDAELGDTTTYECAYCGRSGVGVVAVIVREDQGAVQAERDRIASWLIRRAENVGDGGAHLALTYAARDLKAGGQSRETDQPKET